MIAFMYDKTFDGLLSAVFDAYSLRRFPDILLAEGDFVPLQYTVTHKVASDPAKGARVLAGLQKRLTPESLRGIFHVWLSEEPEAGILLFRYMRAIFDAPAVVGQPSQPEISRQPSRSSRSGASGESSTRSTSGVRATSILSDFFAPPGTLDSFYLSDEAGMRPTDTDFCAISLPAVRGGGQSVGKYVKKGTGQSSGHDARMAQGLHTPVVCTDSRLSAGSRMMEASRVMEVPLRADRNFCNAVILDVEKLADRVGREHMHWLGFVRFQQTSDTVYFSAIKPKYNILPLLLEHFLDRFSSQKWVIYDVRRGYGYYFDLETVQDMYMDPALLRGAQLDPSLLAEGEEQFQHFWKRYCEAIAIPERANPRLQQHFMPKRFWPYLTEKQKKQTRS